MRRVGFALAGCGDVAVKHAEAITFLEGSELVGVYDSNETVMNSLARRYGSKAYGDYHSLLKDPGIDVVVICTPSGLHASMGIAAARAGKNILVEKPMALTIGDADALIKACEKDGVILGVVHQNRFKPAVSRLKRAVEGGRFGRISHANATVRWNRSKEYYGKKTWRRLKSMGGGVLINQAIHNIDLLQWIMGRVVSVFGYTSSRLGLTEGEDAGIAVLRFENGALGVVEAASTIYPKSLEETISVFGETGSAIIGGTSIGEIKLWQFSTPEVDLMSDEERQDISNSPRCLCLENMAETVRTGGSPLVDGREGKKALEIILAIENSCAAGREVLLTPTLNENKV